MSHIRRYTGDIIRTHRLSLGYTLKEIADYLGHSVQFQSTIELGNKDIPVGKVPKVCLILKISPQKMNQALVRSACDRMRAKF